ncbi:MAG: hypothetical protein ACRD2X_02230 [Vicinamibacteraceae bacterium]
MEFEEGRPTVETRLIRSYCSLLLLHSLLALKRVDESVIKAGVAGCLEPSLNDLRAIEAALERTMWGRASLAAAAPDVGDPDRS